MQSVGRSIQDRSQNDLMDRTLCSSKDVGEEEEERVAETVFSRRSGRGPLLTVDVGKLAFVLLPWATVPICQDSPLG